MRTRIGIRPSSDEFKEAILAVAELREGDLVRLKSGGPLMTVTEVDGALGYSIVFVTWFDKGELRSGSFPVSALAKETAKAA